LQLVEGVGGRHPPSQITIGCRGRHPPFDFTTSWKSWWLPAPFSIYYWLQGLVVATLPLILQLVQGIGGRHPFMVIVSVWVQAYSGIYTYNMSLHIYAL
jgi:hypothetical protein